MRTATLIVAAVLTTLLLASSSFGAPPDTSASIPSEGGRVQAPFEPTIRQVGDLNGDHFVDATDLSLLLGSWGRCGTNAWAAEEDACSADLTLDGQVDFDDLIILLGHWN